MKQWKGIIAIGKRKLLSLNLFIMFMLMILMGCEKSKSEIQTFRDIPVYQNASLVEKDQDRAVFFVETLSLSVFKEFYRNNLPVYGWKIIKDISNTITCEKNNQKVMLTYDFSGLDYKKFHDGIIEEGQLDSPSIYITIIFLEN